MAERVDPLLNYHFLVEIQGIVHAGFSECTSMGSSVEEVEYREGGDPSSVRKLLGRASFPSIELKRGVTASRELHDWHAAILAGEADRRDGSIILNDATGEEQVRWNFFAAWPSKWDGTGLNATANEVAIETFTLSCERIERA